MKTAILGGIATLLISFSATAENLVEKAEQFLQALEQDDLNTVGAMLADNIMFEDPTWGVKHEGKAGVLKVYENYSGGARNLRKFRTDGYESAGTVFLNYIYHVEMNIARQGEPENFVPIMGRGGRLVSFDSEGKVVRHTDFADYGAVGKAIEQAGK